MAKDRKKLLHIHSSIPDKQPTAASLEVGEIAVNNAANQEFLSIRNSEDKVKRFSSDEQIITWIEKKEVMPYEGYTRGADGPTGSTGPNSVKRSDLLENKSNVIIKLNQVAAANTAKHNKVNGSKDIYGKCVNPTTDDGVTDGAGFAIDMSRYAMMDANPSFSALTVTDQTNLQGNTFIENGTGTGKYANTNTGHTLNIKTTDVVATDTNWTETITNRTSTVTNETDKITTLNESATTRTTVVGTENLHVSGTTTEVHDKAVTITNNTGVTETTKGDVVENVSGTTTINHSGTTTTNESGDTIINTTGNTTINSTGSTTIQSTGAGSDITIYAKDMICETSDNIGAFKGANTTNIGSDCSNANQTKTLNVRANTADTRVTSAYTSATTATTVIGTLNESATTATLSGNTLAITEATSTTLKSPATTISGTSLTIDEGTSISAKTPATTVSGSTLVLNELTSVSAKTPATYVSGSTLEINEGTSISAKTPTTTISGTNLNITEANTTISTCGKFEVTSDIFSLKQCSTTGGSVAFEFCNGFGVKSNAVNFEQCGDNGTFTVKEKTTNISGTTTNISGATNVRGATTISGSSINISGATTVRGNTNISGTSLTVSAATNITGATTISGATTITGTTNITGATNIKGATTISGSSLSVTGATNLNGNVCVTGTVTASQAIYSSDRNLKENIEDVPYDLAKLANDVKVKSFNFIGEQDRIYGVIAQEVQGAGLGEIVYTKDDGHLAVDYTSLSMLKIAYLENLCGELLQRIKQLQDEIKVLKFKNQ